MKANQNKGTVIMDVRNRKTKLLAASVALAMAQISAMSVARADSGSGQDTSIGNALNKRPINFVTYGSQPDPDGMGTNVPSARTPSGQFYEIPQTPVDQTAFVEFGGMLTGGDDKNREFVRYKDLKDGFYLNSFGANFEKANTANYLEVTGGAVGRDDQFYNLTTGRYNDWRVKVFYNETPHVFSTNFRSIYDGVGSGVLKLSSGATQNGLRLGGVNAGVPQTGAQAVAAADAALRNAGETTIGLVRQKGGIRFDYNLNSDWKVFASYTNEKRKGARPFNYTAGNGGGTSMTVELAEPIDYNSHDAILGMQYADDLQALNLTLTGSWFRNNISSLTVDNPFSMALPASGLTAAMGGLTTSRIDLYPNNDYYNLKGEYARSLPGFYNGRFTAVAAVSSSRQDDDLLPFSVNSGVTLGGLNNWHLTSALSKEKAGAKIDTRLLDLGLSFTPVQDLDVKGKIRYYETKNSTEFNLCNSGAGSTTPAAAANVNAATGCNGVWGRVHDGAVASIVTFGAVGGIANLPTAGNIYIRNTPYEYKQMNYSLAADWRLTNKSSLNASYERETYDREYREREETWEDKFKLGYVNRAIENATLRLSWENTNRRGSHYDPHHAYVPIYSGSFITEAQYAAMTAGTNLQSYVVHMNSRLRKYDLADRNQNIINARVNYMAREDLDLGMAFQHKDIRYPEADDYGRNDKQILTSLNFDATWQPSNETSLYGFYSRQEGKLDQKGVQSGAAAGLNCTIGNNGLTAANAGELCADPNTGRVFNAANFWTQNHKDVNDTLGFGFRQLFGDSTLDINYTYANGKTSISYGAPANVAVTPAMGSGFPDMTTVQNTLDIAFLKPITKSTSIKFLYRYEDAKIRDWHYDGLGSGAVLIGASAPANSNNVAAFADGGPQDYKAHMVGVMFNFKM